MFSCHFTFPYVYIQRHNAVAIEGRLYLNNLYIRSSPGTGKQVIEGVSIEPCWRGTMACQVSQVLAEI